MKDGQPVKVKEFLFIKMKTQKSLLSFYLYYKPNWYRIFDIQIDICVFRKSDNDILVDIDFLYTTHNINKHVW